MDNEKREFKGVWIPREVWLDERLTALEKMIFMEIDSLDGESGCYASNEYLAKFCQCSQAKVSNAITKLRKLGYVELASFDGRIRILHSCLEVSCRQTTKNYKADLKKQEEIILEENTNKESVSKPTLEDVEKYIMKKGASREYAHTFFDLYESQGWKKANGVKITDWKAAARNWLRKDGVKEKRKYPDSIRCRCGGTMKRTATFKFGTDTPYYRCDRCGVQELYHD